MESGPPIGGSSGTQATSEEQMAKNHKTDGGDENVPVEGRHGDKTHSAFIEGLHGKHGGSEESEGSPQAENTDRPIAGNHRLHEDRQQHDEAEKNSESNRLRR
jgi:hypothetical protein